MVMRPTALGLENDCTGEGQQQLYTTVPYCRQRGYYIRTMTENVRLKTILVVILKVLGAKTN
jgi:hypothetical protein